MKIHKNPTSVTVEFHPDNYWLRTSDDEFKGEYMLSYRIDMSYKGKDDQEGSPALYLDKSDAQLFRDAGFSELM